MDSRLEVRVVWGSNILQNRNYRNFQNNSDDYLYLYSKNL